MTQIQPDFDDQIEAFRRFNRFYTRELGLLRRTFLNSPWSLGEVRVLYEINLCPGILAREICEILDLDPAYISRLISRFETKGLISREASAADARQLHLKLSVAGHKVIDAMNETQKGNVGAILEPLSQAKRAELIHAMQTIERLMSETSDQ